MDEVKFIVKSLVITLVVLMLMQIKIGVSTVETETLQWIETSAVTKYLQNVSAGAVLAIRNGAQASSEFIAKTFNQSDANTNRASRFNFEFKRSPQSQPPQLSRSQQKQSDQ